MRIRFYIERRKDEAGNLLLRDRPVFMSLSFQGKRTMIGTGIKTDFQSWDATKQRVRESHPEAITLNARLDILEETAYKTWELLEGQSTDLSTEEFRKHFKRLLPRKSSGFFEVFLLFLEDGGKRWSEASYRKVMSLYRHLRKIEAGGGIRISFSNMDASFLNSFESYFLEKGYRKSTIYKSVNTLVWFLNWATAQGYNVNVEYRRFYKSIGQKDVLPQKTYYLKWDELMDFSQYQCGSRKQERVRDLFCFMCFTGLRYSELQRLKKEDLSEAEIVIKKPGAKSRTVPIGERASVIVRKYANRYFLDNRAFPVSSPVTFNKHLRELARAAGLNRMVPVSSGEIELKALHEQLSAGAAVNTFIANALEMSVAPEVIAHFTGTVHDARVKRIQKERAEGTVRHIA